MKDYIIKTVIQITSRIPANDRNEAYKKCKKEIKKSLSNGTFNITPKRKEMFVIDIVKNREENKIYGDDISILDKE